MWDPFVIFSALGFKLFLGESWRTPASHELYKNKFYSTFLKSMGSYPIKPLGSFEKSLDLTIKKINKGHSIVYFPEGRRSFNSRGSMPRKGVGYLLKSIETNILPIYIEYPNRFKPWRGRVILGNVVNSSYLSKYFNGSNMHEKIMNLVWDLRQ
jgi:1-acyl-sn-glycerol-3-phosphate acyltransferase